MEQLENVSCQLTRGLFGEGAPACQVGYCARARGGCVPRVGASNSRVNRSMKALAMA